MNTPAASISLGLLVIRTADVARTLSFYCALGLDFVEEKHGSGPTHFSCYLGGMILEIYPGQPGSAPERMQAGATLLGFRVASIDHVVSALARWSTPVLSGPTRDIWGRRVVVEDPDGRAVELREVP
jgi:catechol 2,3-dioxygenase-like lactoylglutathione lyase family enzyme